MNREQLKAVGVIVDTLLDDASRTDPHFLEALEAVAVLLGSPRKFPSVRPTAAELWKWWRKVADLDQVPLAVIEGWTLDERQAAEAWGWEWDVWTSDVARGPLSEPPDTLKPYLPPPEGTKR